LRAFGQLAVANAIFTALSFITGPIAAHALGPAGRGQLAAVLVPFSWGMILASVGLPTWATRAAAREDRGRIGAVLGTAGGVSILLGLIGFLIGIPLADVLAPHNQLVHRLILIGLAMLPISLLSNVGVGVLNGVEAWTRLNVMRVVPPLITVVAYVTLLVLGSLTVTAAVAVTYGAALVGMLPLLAFLPSCRPLTFDRPLLRQAMSYGPRAWVGTLASTANNRLDQLIMIPLVSSRQLGLYAVAVNVSALDGFLVSALSTVIGPSVARGDHSLIGRAVRLTILADAVFGLAFALVARWLMPIVFGSGFSAAVPMTYVLLAASVPGAAVWVLGSALQNAGHPGVPARGEILALVVTIAGLIVLLPPLAGLGAAIVSGVAYSTNCAVQMAFVRRRLRIPLSELLIVKRSDLDFLFTAVGERVRSRRAGRGQT
jgi:O-antigen/teichoic acid export membrane protein